MFLLVVRSLRGDRLLCRSYHHDLRLFDAREVLPCPAINSVSNEDSRFAQLDKDTNGKIDAEEGGRGLKSAFEKFDADKDGALSKPEFVEYLKEKAKSGGGGMAAPRGEDEVEPAKEKKEETPPGSDNRKPEALTWNDRLLAERRW